MLSRITLGLSLLAFALLSLSEAASAYYASPEEILEQSQYLPEHFAAPTENRLNKRSTKERHAAQEALRLQTRQSAYSSLSGGGKSETSSSSVGPALQGTASEGSASSADSVTLTLDPETKRLLERLKRSDLSASTADSTLHGGAPLAPTGAASTLAGVALLLAGTWTLLRARKF